MSTKHIARYNNSVYIVIVLPVDVGSFVQSGDDLCQVTVPRSIV